MNELLTAPDCARPESPASATAAPRWTGERKDSAPILLVSDIFPPKTGGSGRWFWEIYRRLPRREIVIAAGQHAQHVEFDATHDLRVVRLPLEMRTRGIRSFGNLKHYFRSAWKLRRLVKNHQVRMVHCGRCLPEGVMARLVKFFCGTPYLCYVHGEEIAVASTSRELSWLARRVFASADFLIANSENTRRLLLDEWSIAEERVKLLYPGVDTERFRPAAPSTVARHRLGWAERSIVLTVGRLQKRKGQDHMILALRELRRKLPEILYCIVGDGEEMVNLRRLVAEHSLHDHVQFLGEPDDERLQECYQQCDLFVLPNRAVGKDIEGFGMVLLEAQACGKAVLAGASGGTAETMQIPETGRVVDCDEPKRLAAAVAEMLADRPRLRTMGESGRRWVCQRFDWSVLCKQASELFLAPAGDSHDQR